MSEVKWIKIVTDIFDDEKMVLIENMPEADSIIVIWFKLLCMAGKQNNNGVFMLNDKIAYTDEMLATVFRRPVNTVRLALSVFENYGMIEIINNVYAIKNWEKHQNIDALERQREQGRLRVAAYRERRKKQLDECNANRNVTVIESNGAEEDIDKEKEIDKEYKKESVKRKTASRFEPPTVEEVSDYCEERKNGVDAQRFVDYYTSNGWKVGRNAMKDWRAAVRTWERGTDEKLKKIASEYDDLG